MNAHTYLNKLFERKNLTQKEAKFVMGKILTNAFTPAQTAAILTATRMKGEEIDEILGFIATIKKSMIRVKGHGAIDVCGSGGDKMNTFNISTAVAFVVAGAGVKVAKHGNRAVGSKCGSADVLEELGVGINLTSSQAEQVLQKAGMVFLFAPLFHPAYKSMATIRKEVGFKTIFNYLGPFLNPASVKKQMIGVPNQEIAIKLLKASKELGYRHLCVVVGGDGMDEVSLTTTTRVFENKNGNVSSFVIDPKTYGYHMQSLSSFEGGSPKKNARIITNILEGKKGPQRDIVVLNAGVALYIARKAKNIREGIVLAEKSLDYGHARKVLEKLKKETQKYA